MLDTDQENSRVSGDLEAIYPTQGLDLITWRKAVFLNGMLGRT